MHLYGAGIRTYDLLNMSLLACPLDQGSRPQKIAFTKNVNWQEVGANVNIDLYT